MTRPLIVIDHIISEKIRVFYSDLREDPVSPVTLAPVKELKSLIVEEVGSQSPAARHVAGVNPCPVAEKICK